VNTDDWTDADRAAAAKCIRDAKAVNNSFVGKIRDEVEKTTTRFTDAGMSLTYARSLAEQCVVNALNDLARQNFRGPL